MDYDIIYCVKMDLYLIYDYYDCLKIKHKDTDLPNQLLTVEYLILN